MLTGLQLAQQIGMRYLEAYGDSKLIINQVKGEYEIRHENLIPYHHAAIKLAGSFDGFYISYVSRLQNTKADAQLHWFYPLIPYTSHGDHPSSLLFEVQYRG